tara:strand:+ start:6707 stop:6940 length:234 start_codon:yes stop_codon:yes gene_type:complete
MRHQYKSINVTLCTFGTYKETQYKHIPLEWLIERLKNNKLTKYPKVNKRIEFYINERIEETNKPLQKAEDIGYICFD